MSEIRWRPRGISPLLALAMLAVLYAAGCSFSVKSSPQPLEERGVGINLDVVNGGAAPLKLSAKQSSYFVQRLNVMVRQGDYPARDVLSWLATQSAFSGLDWSGIRQVKTDWEVESDIPTYEEIRGHLGAHWMDHQEHTFTLQPIGQDDQPQGAPITLTGEQYVIDRRTALSWSTHQPAKGDEGGNHGVYGNLTVDSGGTFGGEQDDIYLVQVLTGGALDGTAQVLVTSVRGDNDAPPPPGPPGPDPRAVAVTSGTPIALGIAGHGATITFTGTDALVAGDRWIVRCGAEEDVVQPAEPTIHATRHATARVFFSVARDQAPLLTLNNQVKALRLTWSADAARPVDVPVTFEESELGYGLEVLSETSLPQNGKYFLPGEKVTVNVQLTDGMGRPLHELGKLPTYNEYIRGQANGIQYFNLGNSSLPAGNGFFGEARLNIMYVAVAGPRDKLGQRYTDHSEDFYVHEVGLPDIGRVVYGGFADPTLWDTPIPSSVEFELPSDVKPGTYVAIVKAARYFLGERIYRLTDIPFQVGSEEETPFHNKSGNCRVCHIRDAALQRIRHGGEQDRICVACHSYEHGVLAEHVHAIHFLSPNYIVPRNDCSLCHLQAGSNTRASEAVCSSCHQGIHPGEPLVNAGDDPYQACATSCHGGEPLGHVRLAPTAEGGSQ